MAATVSVWVTVVAASLFLVVLAVVCATYNIPKRFLQNKGKNPFIYVVGRDNTSCGPHSIFIYEASKIIRNKVASHKLWAMITQVVGHFCDRKL